MPRIKHHFDRTIDHVRRYEHILVVLMKYGFQEIAYGLRRKLSPLAVGRRRVAPLASHRSRPQRLRLALQELGPTFIKFGQLLSTRPDLVPQEYIDELSCLQDRVPPVPFKDIRAELENQFGAKLNDLFQMFEPKCVAAASIAQVHRAVTRDNCDVAVKIRRPGITETLRTECEILENIAGVIKATLAEDEPIDPVHIVREFTRAVRKEIDLANELRNLQRFAHNFASDPTVHIPQVYPDYCTEGVLTMEYIEGVKPHSPQAIAQAGLDGPLIAQRGVRFAMRQIFEFGLFHTDPHPGNLRILPDNVIVPLDFGQVAHLSVDDRQLLGEMILAIVDRDAPALIETFRSHEMLTELTKEKELSADVEEILDMYLGLPLKDIPFAKMMSQTFDVIRRHRVRPPAEFTLMLKNLITVETMGTLLDPNFQLIEALRPYARKLTAEQIDPSRMLRALRGSLRDATDLAVRLPSDVRIILDKVRTGQFQMHVQHEHLESLVRTLGKSSNRVSFAMIIAGLLVGSSMLVSQDGIVLGVLGLQTLGVTGYMTAAVLGLWLVISIIRGK